MCALTKQEKFDAWFGRDWFRKELLNRRNRADCDPFIEIAEMKHKPVKRQSESSCGQQDSTPSKLLTPSSVKSKFERAVENAGADQHIVR
jgi:hypothetical protein